MNKFLERLSLIGTVCLVLWIIYTVFAPLLNTMGATAGVDAPATSWGIAWCLENVGWLFLLAVVGAIGVLVFLDLRKRNR